MHKRASRAVTNRLYDLLVSDVTRHFQWCEGLDVSDAIKNLINANKCLIENDARLSELKQFGSTLRLAERSFKFNGATVDSCRQDMASYKSLVPSVDTSVWDKKLSELSGSDSPDDIDIKAVGGDILSEWRKSYDAMLTKLELEVLERVRNELWAKVKEWLEAIECIRESLGETGILWDLSPGELTKQDIATVVQWSKYIASNAGVRRLCDMLGRMTSAEKRRERELIMSSVSYEIKVPDVNSREEIVGLKFGRSIEDVIPSELATMADPALSSIFDQKFVEGSLLSFEKTGETSQKHNEQVEEWREKVVEDKRGPIIICVDTSGSMSGTPEAVAKAVALSLATKAHKEHRSCFLITFSADMEIFDFGVRRGVADLFDFLKLSFHGGTDVGPALTKGVEMMCTPEYEKADLLVISDFVMSGLPEEVANAIESRKMLKNRFFALTVESGGSAWNRYESSQLFDGAWRFDASKQDVAQLDEHIAEIAAGVPARILHNV